MEYYFKNSAMTQICVRNYEVLPPQIRGLFQNEQGAPSLFSMTKLLPRVSVISLTDMKLDEMAKKGDSYIACIKELFRESDDQKEANIERIEFRSEFSSEHREDSTIEALKRKYQNEMKEKYDCSLRYEFREIPYHRIIAQKINVNGHSNTKSESKKIWPLTPPETAPNAPDTDSKYSKSCVLSLDADPFVLDNLSEHQKEEFGMVTVRKMIGQETITKFKLNVVLECIQQGSLQIHHKVIAEDESGLNEAMKVIDRRSDEVEQIAFDAKEKESEIRSLRLFVPKVFPVLSYGESNDMTLSDSTIKEEQIKRREHEEGEKLRGELRRVIERTEPNRRSTPMEREKRRMKEQNDALSQEVNALREQLQRQKAEKEKTEQFVVEMIAKQEEIQTKHRELEKSKAETVEVVEENRIALREKESEFTKVSNKMEEVLVQTLKSKVEFMLQNNTVNWDKNEETLIKAFCDSLNGGYVPSVQNMTNFTTFFAIIWF